MKLDESRAGDGMSHLSRTTCGLQNSDSPPSDNLTPQENTTQDTGTVGADEANLSCPDSNVVAEDGQDHSE